MQKSFKYLLKNFIKNLKFRTCTIQNSEILGTISAHLGTQARGAIELSSQILISNPRYITDIPEILLPQYACEIKFFHNLILLH